MYGALREGDVMRGAWSGYDGSAIEWSQGKTGDPVWLPAHRELRALLDEMAKTRGRDRRYKSTGNPTLLTASARTFFAS
jgi:hypothetical protein